MLGGCGASFPFSIVVRNGRPARWLGLRLRSGSFHAELELPEGRYVIELESFQEFSPCQDGGIAAFLFEHGDSGCGAVNPAAMQLDFYIRSPESNPANHPGREVFDHFFAMAVTWH